MGSRDGILVTDLTSLAGELLQAYGAEWDVDALKWAVKNGKDEQELEGVKIERDGHDPKTRRARYRISAGDFPRAGENYPSYASYPSPELLPGETSEGYSEG